MSLPPDKKRFFYIIIRNDIWTIIGNFSGDEKSSIRIENKGELLLGKKAINRYHLYVFLIVIA
jgi:hypothetical protein